MTDRGTPRRAPAGSAVAMALLASVAGPLASQEPERDPDPGHLNTTALSLDQAIAFALHNHPLLDRARANRGAASGGIRLARAAALPTLALAGTSTRFAEPMVVAPLHGFDPAAPPAFDRTLVQGRVEAAYRLFDGGARAARTAAARADLGAADATLRAAREEVLAGVTNAYVGRATAAMRTAAADWRVVAADAERRRTIRAFEAGAAPAVDTLRAHAEILSARVELANAEALEDVAVRELARWMGVDADTTELAQVPLWVLKDPTPPAGVASASASADVERAASRARSADATAAAARASRLPKLDLQAGLLEFGSGAGDFQGEWQAGVAVSFPVFTGGARGAEIDRAAALARAADADLRLARLGQESRIDHSRAALTAATGRVVALEQRVEALEEIERIVRLSASEGAATTTEALDAGADLSEARADLATAIAERVRALLELARAQGLLTAEWIVETLSGAE